MPFVTVDTRQNFRNLLATLNFLVKRNSEINSNNRSQIQQIISTHLSTTASQNPNVCFSEIISFASDLAEITSESNTFLNYGSMLLDLSPCADMIKEILHGHSLSIDLSEKRIYRQTLNNFDMYLANLSDTEKCSFSIPLIAFEKLKDSNITFKEIAEEHVTRIRIEHSSLKKHSVFTNTGGSINTGKDSGETDALVQKEPACKCCCVVS
jgi:hypothetical protein